MASVNKYEELDESKEMPSVADDSLISSQGRGGVAYDWSTAPETVRAPPRINLDGKTVVITKADIMLPPESDPWEQTKDKKKECKRCPMKLFYNVDGQAEFLSGVRVFKANDGKYSPPSIPRDGINQASALVKLYAEFKGKNINEVSLREFMGFLNSQPKVVIKAVDTRNPSTGATIKKNIPAKFL